MKYYYDFYNHSFGNDYHEVLTSNKKYSKIQLEELFGKCIAEAAIKKGLKPGSLFFSKNAKKSNSMKMNKYRTATFNLIASENYTTALNLLINKHGFKKLPTTAYTDDDREVALVQMKKIASKTHKRLKQPKKAPEKTITGW